MWSLSSRGGGGKALVAELLKKKHFFAAFLTMNQDFFAIQLVDFWCNFEFCF